VTSLLLIRHTGLALASHLLTSGLQHHLPGAAINPVACNTICCSQSSLPAPAAAAHHLAILQEGYDSAKKAVGDAAENVKEGAQDLGDRITGKQ
jgi:hypothetical protein